MNRKEVVAVLAMLSANWPSSKLTEPTIAQWCDQLSGVHPDDGLTAANDLILHETGSFMPNVGKFHYACLSAARRRVNYGMVTAIEAPKPAESERERVRALIAETKAKLAGDSA